MKSSITFSSSSWDMADTWGIIEGESYPFLRETVHPPIFTIERIPSAVEDEPYSFDIFPYIRIFDTPGMIDTFTMSIDAGSDWYSISSNGLLTGLPGNEHVGSFLLNISAQDSGGRTTRKTFDLEVENVNDPPVITTVPLLSILQDEPYSLRLEAYDIDPTGDVLTFSLSTDAAWLSLDQNYLNGTPENDDVGVYWVNITVNDGNGGNDHLNFTLEVINVNDPPVITTTPITSILQDERYSLRLEAYDIDPVETVFSWDLVTDAEWLSLEGDMVSGVPTNDDVGRYDVRITVSDGEGGSDSMEFRLDVMDVNDPPYWVTVPEDATVREGQDYMAECLAMDVDPGDVITYSISSTPSSGITVMSVSGIIRYQDPVSGTYIVNLTATDGENVIWHLFTLEVEAEDTEDTEAQDTEGWDRGILLIICSSLTISVLLIGVLVVLMVIIIRSKRKRGDHEE